MASPAPPRESVLVVNAGSSSLKVKAYPSGRRLVVERIGEGGRATHDAALEESLARLGGEDGFGPPLVVGHRVVHGGTAYTQPTVVDDDVEAGIAALCDLAPLHNPAKDRKSTRLNSSHVRISYAVFCLKKKTKIAHLN